jgi:hypothetical protein
VRLNPRLLIALAFVAAGVALHACRTVDAPPPAADTVQAPTQHAAPVRLRSPRARAIDDEATLTEPEAKPPSSTPSEPQHACVAGTVRTDDGVAVPGAFVALGDLDASDDTALTDANGHFEINEMPSYSTVQVAAHVGGSTWRGAEPADGAPIRVDVTVRRQAAPEDRVVLVHVRGHDGTPIPRARAEAVGGELAEPWRWDTGGLVAVAGACFPVRVKRWKDGARPTYFVSDARNDEDLPLPYGPALVVVDLHGADEVDVRLPPGAVVRGTVETSAGRAAPGIVVYMTPALPEGYDIERLQRPRDVFTWTDESGHFGFSGLARGSTTLRVAPHKGEHGGCGATEVRLGDENRVLRLAPVGDR